MSGKQFHFLSPNTGSSGLPANRKALEAARSEARSHAAKVSYPPQHRVQRKPLIRDASEIAQASTPEQYESVSEDGQSELSSETSSPESATSLESIVSQGSAKVDNLSASNPNLNQATGPVNLKFRIFVKKDRPKKNVAKKVLSAQSTSAKLPKAISKSTLDPFVRPAFELSVPDEHLLHLYLSTVPDELYGKSAGSASDLVRQGTLGVVANNDIVLMWLLLTIESQVVSFQPTNKDRQMSIFSRQAQAYKVMNERLTKNDGSPLDFAFTIAIAASCEHRMANPTGAAQHIGAVKNLLSLQGGFKAVRDITYPLNLMVVNILVEQGDPGLFDCWEDVRSKLKAIVQRLQDYQIWNHDIRFRGNNLLSADLDISQHSQPKQKKTLPSLDHLQRRARAFNNDSALAKYVTLPSDELDEGQCKFFLSIFYAINTAFWDFRGSMKMSNAYLKELNAAVDLSIGGNFVLRAGGSKLPSLLMLLMLTRTAAAAESRDTSTGTVFHDEEVFEFVIIIMMASSQTRLKVLKALSSWLTTDTANVDNLTSISAEEFDALEREVEDKWLADQTRRFLDVGPG